MATGKTQTLEVGKDDDVILVKCRIWVLEGIPTVEQRLIFAAGGKPIIRLRSNSNKVIPNVNVSLQLDTNVWELSSIYPQSFVIYQASFIEWQGLQVYPNGMIKLAQDEKGDRQDRDDMLTYILPHLDESDPNFEKKNIVFRFLSYDEYSSIASLNIHPMPEQITRAFLIYSFGENDLTTMATLEELEDEVKKVVLRQQVMDNEKSGLVVEEWGSTFIP
ncbi:unnamed protein product [Rotaria magnacalcarata]|nr:unnamed protein product [Rotaria magnacalcarata]CAF1219113.1 unnamed protein product [Rotaria magnacalcarata]